MKKWKNILMCVALGGALVSCVDLDLYSSAASDVYKRQV